PRQHFLYIRVRRERIGDNAGIFARVFRPDHDLSAAGRSTVRQADREAGPRIWRQDRPLAAFRYDRRKGLEVELHVGLRPRRIGAEEAAGTVHRQGEWT